MSKQEDLLSVEDAAKRLGLRAEWLHGEIATGRLPAFKVGDTYLLGWNHTQRMLRHMMLPQPRRRRGRKPSPTDVSLVTTWLSAMYAAARKGDITKAGQMAHKMRQFGLDVDIETAMEYAPKRQPLPLDIVATLGWFLLRARERKSRKEMQACIGHLRDIGMHVRLVRGPR